MKNKNHRNRNNNDIKYLNLIWFISTSLSSSSSISCSSVILNNIIVFFLLNKINKKNLACKVRAWSKFDLWTKKLQIKITVILLGCFLEDYLCKIVLQISVYPLAIERLAEICLWRILVVFLIVYLSSGTISWFSRLTSTSAADPMNGSFLHTIQHLSYRRKKLFIESCTLLK